MKRLKVCHIMHDGSGQGGGATFAMAYFPAYNEDFDTLVVTGNEGGLAERLRAHGVKTVTLSMSRPWRSVLYWPWLWYLLWREKPDGVVVHGQWGGFFGSVAARMAGVKTILYYTHFPSFYTDWDFFRLIRNRIAESFTCRLVSRVVCLSQSTRYQYLLRRFTSESKFVHISNGLDPAGFQESIDSNLFLRELSPAAQPGDQIVVSVGRLADQKRIDLLLRAWAIVEPRVPRARLAIIGAGPEEKMLHRLASKLNLQRCRFLGSQPNGYVYFGVADCGVICSMFEGQPLALIEAMFIGCPMVGTNVDGIRETIVDGVTGLLVPPADPEALAEGIISLLANPIRAREMGEAGRQRAQEIYRSKPILQQQLDLLKSELKKNRTRS